MKKHYLMTPGPTPIPEEILKAMAEPIIHHRTPQYREMITKVNADLKKIFKTNNNVLTFASSGTGAMEAGVVNTLSKGDTAIFVNGGKFGERFGEICASYGVKSVAVDVEWGNRPEPDQIEKALKENPGARAVFMQLCETSTATVYDVRSIGEVTAKSDAVLVVDAISGLGADDLEMDAWGVDIVIGGSQKGFMIPPGLSFCGISDKAWRAIKSSTLPKFYFDFNKYNKVVEKGDSPFTPGITLAIGLGKAMDMILKEGVDNFINRHKSDAEFVRSEIRKMKLEIFSKFPSDAVTAVNVPDRVDGGQLIKALKAKDVTFAGGQGHLKGKIFRLAHMGGIGRKDIEFALEKLKEALKDLGYNK